MPDVTHQEGVGWDGPSTQVKLSRSSTICFVPDTFLYIAPDILHRGVLPPVLQKSKPRLREVKRPALSLSLLKAKPGGSTGLPSHIQLAVTCPLAVLGARSLEARRRQSCAPPRTLVPNANAQIVSDF